MLSLFTVPLVLLIEIASAFPAAATDAQIGDGPTVDLGYGLWKATFNVGTCWDMYCSLI